MLQRKAGNTHHNAMRWGRFSIFAFILFAFCLPPRHVFASSPFHAKHIRREPSSSGFSFSRKWNSSTSAVEVGSSVTSFEIFEKDPLKVEITGETSRKCGEAIYAPGGTCPLECPFLAEEGIKGRACYFRCVTDIECGENGLVRSESVPDAKTSRCRRCHSYGCKICEAGTEICQECMKGYQLSHRGDCKSAWSQSATVFVVGGALVFVFSLMWLLQLLSRPQLNKEGWKHGMAFRSNTIVAMNAHVRDEPRQPFPMSVDLCTEEGAGGIVLCLHMHFQKYMIFLPLVLGLAYVIIAVVFDHDLLRFGLRSYKDKYELCGIIQWGNLKAQELQYIILFYCVFAYLFTFLSSAVLAMTHEITYRAAEARTTSMKQFALRIGGLPPISGQEYLEVELQNFIEERTQIHACAVSVCWDFGLSPNHETVTMAHEQDLEDLEQYSNPIWQRPLQRPVDAGQEWRAIDQGAPKQCVSLFTLMDLLWRRYVWGAIDWDPKPLDVVELRRRLDGLSCSPYAYVVYNRQEDRDRAHMIFNKSGNTDFRKNSRLYVERADCEPQQVLWHNYGVLGTRPSQSLVAARSIGVTVLAVAFWSFAVYSPMTYYLSAESYASGASPGMFNRAYWFQATIVWMANLTLVWLSESQSSAIGYDSEHKRIIFRNTLYTISSFALNLVVILWSCFYAYDRMKNLGVHTADGRHMKDLNTWKEIVESYPMQKSMGAALYFYTFPMTIFIPVLLQIVFTTILTDWINELLALARPEIRGRKAELAMGFAWKMDFCRYADCIKHMMLAALVSFVASGWTHVLFFALAFCQTVNYFYDKWRILRHTAEFNFTCQSVDRNAMVLLSLPGGIFMSGVIFRTAQIYADDMRTGVLLGCMAAGFVAHCLLHYVVVLVAIPRGVASSKYTNYHENYPELAARKPASFFTCNPVHCLRTNHLFYQDPPCFHYEPGHSNLMWKNPEHGTYFETTHLAYPRARVQEQRRKAETQAREALKALAEEAAAEQAAAATAQEAAGQENPPWPSEQTPEGEAAGQQEEAQQQSGQEELPPAAET